MKSFKVYLRRVVGDERLTYEELAMVLTQIETCLNSRPLTPLPEPDDGLEALTPGHFLIGRPLNALPDPSSSYQSCLLLKRWQLCQALVRNFWKRWFSEYFVQLRKFSKLNFPSRNFEVGDLVCLHEDGIMMTK